MWNASNFATALFSALGERTPEGLAGRLIEKSFPNSIFVLSE